MAICTVCSATDLPAEHALVMLPCGCADVVYPDGRVCHEHDHVCCDGQPAAKEDLADEMALFADEAREWAELTMVAGLDGWPDWRRA
jgi:hypothetical protein